MRNSPTKPFSPGTPIDASITTVKNPASTGARRWRPAELGASIEQVCRR